MLVFGRDFLVEIKKYIKKLDEMPHLTMKGGND